jgi:hypothetical protein
MLLCEALEALDLEGAQAAISDGNRYNTRCYSFQVVVLGLASFSQPSWIDWLTS